MIKRIFLAIGLATLALIVFQSFRPNQSKKVEIISNQFEVSSPSSHGLKKIVETFKTKNLLSSQGVEPSSENSDYYIFAGLSTKENQVTKLLQEMNVSLPKEKEALVVRKTTFKGKPTILLCGADEVGLMYATLDVAKRISWSKSAENLFQYVIDATEAPDVKERCMSMGTFQRRYFEQRLHDTIYWTKYFDMMAENRLNQFILMFGYKNNQYHEPEFTAPVYPNFFNVEQYPYVKMSNVSAQDQQKNREALKKIIALAHSRGIEFGVGLWDQIARNKKFRDIVRDDVDAPADLPADIIWGLSENNLIPYTKLAMRKFFQTFPDIDLVQFRMHWESGISGDVALKFWKEIFIMLKEDYPKIKIEARAKGVPDETIYDGVATGADFRVATKHWMEHLGLPFHPTHINPEDQVERRHGYADLLRYPKQYGFKWRIWNGGTTRVFLWGDPEWVKTFAQNSHLYDAVGFEFNEPLYFKMNGSKQNAEVFNLLNPEYQYTDYEFERYWHYFQVMGRIGYNPNASPDLWKMEFTNRFGAKAGEVLMDGLHQASKVLPRIVSASYLYARFPSEVGWAEMQRMGDLKSYALDATPTDVQQFASPKEEAQSILAGEFSVRRQASETSDWFSQTSKRILSDVEQAEKSIGENKSKEYVSTITDLKMLAYLAKYHSQRLLAAVQYNLYTKTGDLVSFDKALMFESQAVDAYGNLAKAAGNVYNSQLDFGSNKEFFPGHWSKEHQRLKDELQLLKEDRKALDAKQQDIVAHIPIQRVLFTDKIVVSATVRPQENVKSARVWYALSGNKFTSLEMKFGARGICTAEIPNPKREKVIKYYIEITYNNSKTETSPKNGSTAPYVILVSNDRTAPIVKMERILTAKLNKDLKVSAQINDPSGINSATLRYRRLSQFEDYQVAPMKYNPVTKQYEANIPSAFFDGKYDVMYFIEAMDTKGNGHIYPDLEQETPYVIIHLDRK